MKKALALVLALVLALSMGVSAFALDLVEVVLKPATPASAEIIDITEYQLGTDADYGTKYLVGPKGGVYYITLDGSKEFKNIELSATGMVTAKVLDYDPESYTGADTEYVVKYEDAAVVLDETNAKDVLALATANGDYVSLTFGGMVTIDLGEASTYKQFAKALAEGKTIEEAAATLGIALPLTDVELNTADTSYKFAKALAKALNNQYQTSKFEVANVNEENVYVIELTVEENYTSSYKLGSVKVSAEEVLYEDAKGRDVTRPVANTISIVSDVAIFEYEMVKWAGKTGNSLVVNSDKGYSAFLTDGKYADKYGEYDEFELRYDDATVISTTAFRALRENEYGIVVETPHMEVAIEEIGAQRGVNFAYMVADDEWELGTDIVRVYDKDLVKKYGMDESFFDHIEFGFLGEQTIATDYVLTVDLGLDAFELRELFGEKVEEEDIITFYLLKDGKETQAITIDYMTVDYDKDIVLEIKGKAGSTLGQYELVLEAPVEAEVDEENPNTGAESVVGVVAALAVVSVATAAAVSLKK